MKMPASVGTKKAKAVEQLLEELGVGKSRLHVLQDVIAHLNMT